MEKELAKNAGAGDMTSAIENALPLKKIAPYAWLIYSLMGFFLTLFLTGLITTNLVGAYYTIVSSIISKKTIKTNPQTEQNQNS
jgi:mannose/fructose/N-acetylgalactosamine-specific phosphotransferase system component IIC